MTLLAVPPGQQPTNMTPIAKSEGNVKYDRFPKLIKALLYIEPVHLYKYPWMSENTTQIFKFNS